MTAERHRSSDSSPASDRLAIDRLATALSLPVRLSFWCSRSRVLGQTTINLLADSLARETGVSVIGVNRVLDLGVRKWDAAVWAQVRQSSAAVVEIRSIFDAAVTLPAMIIASRIHGFRVVALMDFETPHWQLPGMRRIVVPACRQADALVAPTEWQLVALRRHGLRGAVIPPLVPSLEIQPRQAVQPHLLVRIEKRQLYDLERILQSFALVKQKYPRAELTVVRHLRIEQQVSSCLRAASGSVMSGVRVCAEGESNTADKCDCAICLDSPMGFPRDLLSAWNLGIPALLPAFSLAASLVQDRGNGLVYSSESTGSLAGAIIELVEDQLLVQELSRQGLGEAQQYHWPALRARWLNLLTATM